MIRIFLAVFCVIFFSGCAQQQGLYDWGNYEQAYYAYAKDPGETDAYLEALGEIISDGEESDRVPPGLYAEYGYALLVAGRSEEAMANFTKERKKWPESRRLMDLLIDGPTAATPPLGNQSDISDREPDQATPSDDAAIIDAPVNSVEPVGD